MMEEYQQLLDALKHETLSSQERNAIRSRLIEYMQAHPALAPLRLRLLDRISNAKLFPLAERPRLQFLAAALALVFVAGGGTAYAASGALPGEPLYGLKVNIEEPIQGALQTSPQAQAQWSEQLAATRLSEAEQLAAQDKLTPDTASQVVGGLDEATDDFDASVSQLAATSSNVAVVANLESDLEATLAANTQVLGELASAYPSAAPAMKPIISRAQSGAISLDGARTQLDAVAARTSVAQVQAAAEAQLDAAEAQLTSIAVASSDAPVPAQVALAQEAVQAGRQNLSQGNYQAALETSQTATLDAQEALVNQSIGGALGVQIAVSASSTATSTQLAADVGAATSTAEATSTAATTTPVIPIPRELLHARELPVSRTRE